MRRIRLSDLHDVFFHEGAKKTQLLLERHGLDVFGMANVDVFRTADLGDLLPSVVNVLRHSLFEPDNSPTELLERDIRELFYSMPDATNYVIVRDHNRVLGTAQIYVYSRAAILNGIGFLPVSSLFPDSVRGRGYYPLLSCLRFIFVIAADCHFVSGITSNPRVLQKFDEWGFYYSPSLYSKLHTVSRDDPALAFPRLKQEVLRLWTQICGQVEAEELIIRVEHVPHGKFVVRRSPSRNEIINDFVETNLKMGDRMIIIREVNESFKTLVSSLLSNMSNKFLPELRCQD